MAETDRPPDRAGPGPWPASENPVAPAPISPKAGWNPVSGPTILQTRPLPLAAFATASLLPVLLIGLGLIHGGIWLWAAFLYMACLTLILDQLVPLVPGQSETTEFPGADLLLAVIGLSALVLLPATTWAIAGPSSLGGGESLLAFLASGFWLGQVGHPAAHELIHRGSRPLFRLGAGIYVALLFGQHASAHRLIHHRHVASPEDPNTAREGESFYRFARRAWMGSFRKGRAAETALRARVPNPGLHPYAAYLAGSAAALLLATLIGGLPGLLTWAGLALHAQSQILLSDYVQHYGLSRSRLPDGRLEPVGAGHSWNTAHWFTGAMMLNAPRHSDHHLHPTRPFPALRLPDDAPCLPWPLPLACALALSPRLWRRAIAPHLARWRDSRPPDPPPDTAA